MSIIIVITPKRYLTLLQWNKYNQHFEIKSFAITDHVRIYAIQFYKCLKEEDRINQRANQSNIQRKDLCTSTSERDNYSSRDICDI